MDYKQTNIQKISLEVSANKKLNEIRKEKPKQCCFKNRLVDAFIVGATRAYYMGRIPKDLPPTKKSVIDSIPTPDLKDKDEIIFYFQVLAYTHLLEEYSGNEDKLNEIHSVLFDLDLCCKTAERYFKGGWEIPEKENFLEICNSEFPDSNLINEIDFSDFLENRED